MIRLDHISYNYPGSDVAALHDLSLEIADGESVCVMGRNGSGKSTLIKLIAGLLPQSRGSIRVGDSLAGGESKPGDIAILFQNPENQMVASVVEKEIAFALENQALPQNEMEPAVYSVARQFGIASLLDRLTNELSGGEKQRVALAAVMVHQPSVLLLDEPDSFLDQDGRQLLATELQQLHAQNQKLVEMRITQSVEIATAYPRLIVLDQGGIVADGVPSEILADRQLAEQTGLLISYPSDNKLSLPNRLQVNVDYRPTSVARIDLSQASFAWPLCQPLFENLSLSLKAGETVCLVGPTGAGKSSLGLLISGLVEPVAGTIDYYDKSDRILSSSDRRGQVALVLQQPERQFFLDNCADEIKFGPSNFNQPMSESETEQFFRLFGLDPARYAKRDPFSLSAGEKRRLAFAAVLAMAPSMVVFDEPTAGLDGEGVGQFISHSRELRTAGLGQMIISHDGDVINCLADRVLYLTAQKQLLELTPDQLLSGDRYASVVSRPTTQGQNLG